MRDELAMAVGKNAVCDDSIAGKRPVPIDERAKVGSRQVFAICTVRLFSQKRGESQKPLATNRHEIEMMVLFVSIRSA